jgi:hypothetical protein
LDISKGDEGIAAKSRTRRRTRTRRIRLRQGYGAISVYRGKVFTVFTLLIISNLSVYKTPYIF